MSSDMSFKLFTELSRIVGNFFLVRRLNRLAIKLDSNRNIREQYIDEMFFTAGKKETQDMDKDYLDLKKKAGTIKTEKFATKGVFEIDHNNTLVLVLCTDQVVIVGKFSTELKKRYRILFFNLKKDVKRSVIELNSYSYTNLGINNLLKEYYQLLSK